MSSAKKDYFKELSSASIAKSGTPVYADFHEGIVERIFSLKQGEYLILDYDIFQQGINPKKFLKHGDFVEVGPASLEQAVREAKMPNRRMRDAFDIIEHPFYAGYSFRPFADFQNDRRERRIGLVELCEGARIVSYGAQTGNDIRIGKSYDKAAAVIKNGAQMEVAVPSRTKGKQDYEFMMRSVVVNSRTLYAHAVAFGFNTTSNIKVKTFRELRYPHGESGSNATYISAHEIAAYFKFMMHPDNLAALRMSPFAVPTNNTLRFYKTLLSGVLVHDTGLKSKKQLRKLNKGEKEIMLWSMVKSFGYKNTFARQDLESLAKINWDLESFDVLDPLDKLKLKPQ